jgi:hypothetical protein
MTTAWDQYLSGFDDPEKRKAALAWFDSRPPAIQSLAHRFPPGSETVIKDRTAYVVGYCETGDEPGLFFTHTDPRGDYEEAVRSKFFVCGEHLAE